MFIIDTTGSLLGAMFFSGLVSTLFSAIFVIIAILLVAAEEFAWGYVTLIVYATLLAIFTPINPFMTIWHNPLQVLGFFILYFVIGAIYSTLKYGSFVRKLIQKVKDIKQGFISEHNLTIQTTDEIPEEFQKVWKEYKNHKLSYSDKSKLEKGIRPTDQASLIMNWIAFWPFSAIGLFIADPLKHLVTSIYEHMISIYSKMYDHIVSKNINIKDIK
jgi:hypothetical protein